MGSVRGVSDGGWRVRVFSLRLNGDAERRFSVTLKLVDELNFHQFRVRDRFTRSPREKWHEARLLVLEALAAEVAASLEAPVIVAARQIRHEIDVRLDLDIDFRPERGQELQRVVEACFDVLVKVDDPSHRSVKVSVEVAHRNDEEIMLIPSCLLPVV